jgi:hypothetical protein
MYPTAAGKIASHGPYKTVKDIYKIEGLKGKHSVTNPNQPTRTNQSQHPSSCVYQFSHSLRATTPRFRCQAIQKI